MRGVIWTVQNDGKTAHLHYGGLLVGSAGERDDGTAFWSIYAVKTKWICKGNDHAASSLDAATRALERAWGVWLNYAGLALADDAGVSPDQIWGEVVAKRPRTSKRTKDTA